MKKITDVQKIIEIFPDFKEKWEEHLDYWGDEEAGDYNDAAEVVHLINDRYKENDSTGFKEFFKLIEEALIDGNSYLKDLAVVGYLETLQDVSSWAEYNPDDYLEWMDPNSKAIWEERRQLWAGGKSLMDIVREEANEIKKSKNI